MGNGAVSRPSGQSQIETHFSDLESQEPGARRQEAGGRRQEAGVRSHVPGARGLELCVSVFLMFGGFVADFVLICVLILSTSRASQSPKARLGLPIAPVKLLRSAPLPYSVTNTYRTLRRHSLVVATHL